MISGRTRIAGVIGAPVSHSLSPLLMNSWIAAAGLDAAYLPFPACADFSGPGLRAISQSGLAGLNVTLPFKTLAAEIADIRTADVAATGAANLLIFSNGKIEARNTDIDGILHALSRAGQSFKGKSVLVLGAGGVARAACAAARQGAASKLVIANRTRARADDLAAVFDALSVNWAERQDAAEAADIVINATSLGMDGRSSPEFDFTRCLAGMVVFDTVYTPIRRPFMETARAAGLIVIDGLSMLIGQARPSFEALYDAPVPESLDADRLLREALAHEHL